MQFRLIKQIFFFHNVCCGFLTLKESYSRNKVLFSNRWAPAADESADLEVGDGRIFTVELSRQPGQI